MSVLKRFAWAATAAFSWLTLTLPVESARADYQLLVSLSPDRSAAVPLQGATVEGNIFIFTCRIGFIEAPECDDGVAASTTNRVNFFLDGDFIWSERLAPFDFAGGSILTANPFKTATIENGPHTITAELPTVDGGTAVTQATFTVDTAAANQTPILATIGTQTIIEDATLKVTVSASDPDGDIITLASSDIPNFATFVDNGGGTGTLDLAPIFGDVGVYPVTITASDETLTDVETFDIKVIGDSEPPIITQQPRDQTVVESQRATFSVQAVGKAPLCYVWQKAGVDIPGGTGPSYTTPATMWTDSGSWFRVKVTNAEGSITSDEAALTVGPDSRIVVDQNDPRWLYYADGRPFFLCGAGDPENFLYRGTRSADGTRNGDQMELITKMGGTGANGIYFQIIRSHGGDGASNHNPFIGSNPSLGLNQNILDQWETWFTAMDQAGIVTYLFFFDDSANIWGGGDAVPLAEQEFLEAIVARFKHHKLLIWVIAEEYGEAFTAARVANMAATIRAADDNDHPIAVHKNSGLSFAEFADDPNIDQFAIQYNQVNPEVLHDGMVTAFNAADGRYNLNMSEAAGHGAGAQARRKNWAVAMGGAYVMVLGWDIAGTAVRDLEDCGRLVSFMESTNFHQMEPRDDFAFGGTEYVLASPAGSFILYASSLSDEIGVRGIDSGTYYFRWLDITTGTLVEQTDVAVTGGDATWPRPPGIGEEMVVWIDGSNLPPTSNQPPTVLRPDDQSNAEGDGIELNIDASDPDGDTLTYSATGLPDTLSIAPSTGLISGIIAIGSAASYLVSVNVSDGIDNTSVTFNWNVFESQSVVIVDNLDPNTSSTGTWSTSSGANPHNGNSVYNNGGNTFTWMPTLPSSGTYEVYAWWTYHANRSSSVPYRISHDGGTATVTVNQLDQGLAGQWNLLGIFTFTPGANGEVSISSENGQANADAIRFNRIDSEPPSPPATEVIIDNLDPNTSSTGTWSTSSGANPHNGNSVYNNGGNTFTWMPTLPSSGTYEVYAWWTYHANRSSSVPYRISHDGGTATVTVNQLDQGLAGQWNLLGTFTFTPGANGEVSISSENGQANADAVRWVWTGSTP